MFICVVLQIICKHSNLLALKYDTLHKQNGLGLARNVNIELLKLGRWQANYSISKIHARLSWQIIKQATVKEEDHEQAETFGCCLFDLFLIWLSQPQPHVTVNSAFSLRVLFSRHSPFRAVIYLFYGDILTELFCSFAMRGKSFHFPNIKVHLLTLVQWCCDMLELQSLMVLLMTCSSWAQSKAANEPEPLCESLWEIWTIDHKT